jgi:AraC family transcriptional regulator of adaptative response / DNA-3-methyladenine glycosylase II
VDDLLDPNICWEAIYSRDPRFDGRFFAAATTTGLYCRNICPVPFARPKHIVLFACAAAAESAGFRPCKRCQPQAAPGTPAWLGTSAVTSRAFRLILEGALNGGSVDQLAERLGLGSRQLRRLFVQHLGASPLKIATTQRIHLALNLIEESKFPMTEIAFCSGFKSIREFNHAIRSSTGQSPSELRRASVGRPAPARQSALELRLPYRAPFDWENLIAFLKRNATPGVEVVSINSYQRTIEIGGAQGFFTVRPDLAHCRLIVNLELSSYEGLAQTVERIRRIFDLAADPFRIANHLSRDGRLRQSLKLHPGLRVPGVWDGFEGTVLAILGETLTMRAPRRVTEQLVKRFGTPIDTGVRGLTHIFPQPEALAIAPLSKIGMANASAATLRNVSAAAAQNKLAFETSRTLDEIVERVMAAANLDESVAHYVAMRSFAEPDAFPFSDTTAIATASAWRPWRAYAAMHIAIGSRKNRSAGSDARFALQPVTG